MARVQVDVIVDYLSLEMMDALVDAVNETIPGATFSPDKLFQAFKRAVRQKCAFWERVPDQYVEAED